MQKPSNTLVTVKIMTLGLNIKQKRNPAMPNAEENTGNLGKYNWIYLQLFLQSLR